MTHLHDAHNIKRRNSERGGDFGDYLREHFPVPKCCCGCGEEVQLHRRDFSYSFFSKHCSNINRFRNPSCVEFYLYQGIEVDDAIIALSDRQSSIAKKYSTDDLKKLLSERSRGARNPMSYNSLESRLDKPKEEIQKILSKKSGGENNGFNGRAHTDETKKKSSIASAKARANMCRIVTKPELVIWSWLHSLNVDFQHECFIEEYVVDYVFGRIVIEVYGDYWHSDRIISNKSGKTKTRLDEERKCFLESLGYIVHVFWESEIMKNPKETFAKLKNIVEKYEN